MTLLITILAAVICTVIWYNNADDDKMLTKVLCYMYWGASIMWFVDAVFEYIELKAEFFTPNVQDMLNDAYLGLSVVALGLTVWIIILLIKDPKGVVKDTLLGKKK